ncbi:ThiF family adenylyltransferase [Fodinibius salsisoli]|uniref:ThiF family adenylyltransferase n=1 Tax=Fodinibius salsisoli TaxID=2820877 RepID=A0ABT3PLL6_9BACT|nr:ThiF family adenylyltransferase [Fodinibius salsisoli]MCW9706831.1 ThiF family adenylyltransferase [Fodinibius salsisoli]
MINDYPLIRETEFSAVITSLTESIDPYGDFQITDSLTDCKASISVGKTELSTTYYTGGRGTVGILSKDPIDHIDWQDQSKIGAAMASTLAAAALLRKTIDKPVRSIAICAWNYEEVKLDAGNYPEVLNNKPDLGNSLIIGAGAVGSAFSYWLQLLGFKGSLALIDKDPVQLHNTNRSLLFIPDHSDWFTGPALNKVDVLGETFKGKCRSIAEWYDEVEEIKDEKFDIIYCLANERDVRTRIMSRYPLVVLHATTGHNWVSQLHRHIYGTDDCIRCRMNDIKEVKFECSKGEVKKDEETEVEAPINNRDAALPFLSTASGLFLYTLSLKMANGYVSQDKVNDWRMYFDFLHDPFRKGAQKCQSDCPYSGKDQMVRKIQSDNKYKEFVN